MILIFESTKLAWIFSNKNLFIFESVYKSTKQTGITTYCIVTQFKGIIICGTWLEFSI